MTLNPVWNVISIWSRFTVTLPMVEYFDNGKPERRTILARLSTPKDKTPCFHTVFVDPESDDPNTQDGLRGK